MKYLKYLLYYILAITTLTIYAQQTLDNHLSNYGTLKSSTLIRTLNTSDLQQHAINHGLCNGIDQTKKLVRGIQGNGTDLCNDNMSYVKNTPALFGKIDPSTFIKNNPYNISTISAYQIVYTTLGQAHKGNSHVEIETVSGLVLIPHMAPQQQVKGIIMYYHPTIFSKNGVPSDLTAFGKYFQNLLAGIYASQGYIVIAPDYVGQGVDHSVMHPYVMYPQTNAISGIYMLKSARDFLAVNGIINSDTTLPLYISSYSEGGAYAIWASRLLQADYKSILRQTNLDLKLSVGISGAYNLSGAVIPYVYDQSYNTTDSRNTYNASPGMFKSSKYFYSKAPYLQMAFANLNMSLTKSVLATYAFASFINYNYNSSFYTKFFSNTQFIAMNNTCLNMEQYFLGKRTTGPCPYNGSSIQKLFSSVNYDNNVIVDQIFSNAMGTTNYFIGNEPSFTMLTKSLSKGEATNNSVSNFVYPILDNRDIMRQITPADTWSFVTTSPIALVYLNYDSIVTNLSAIDACYKPQGVKNLSPAGQVNCFNVDNQALYTGQDFGDSELPLMMDHNQGEFVLNLVALNQFKQQSSK